MGRAFRSAAAAVGKRGVGVVFAAGQRDVVFAAGQRDVVFAAAAAAAASAAMIRRLRSAGGRGGRSSSIKQSPLRMNLIQNQDFGRRKS